MVLAHTRLVSARFGSVLLSVALGISALSGISPAWAQDDEDEDETSEEAQDSDSAGMRARFEPADVLEDLSGNDDELRLQAVKRLATMSDPMAIELLIRAVRPDGAARTPKLRLAAVRSLSHFSADVSARRALVTVLSGAGLKPDAADAPLEHLARETAAMALADSAEPDAVMVLSKALRQGGPTSTAAALALEAHPPDQLGALLATPGTASTHLVDVLSTLADQRAFHPLRSYVMHGSQEVRAHAAVALTELGHLETVPLARHWLGSEGVPVPLRLAATRILMMARTRDAAEHLNELLNAPDLAEDALAMAFRLPHPGVGRGLRVALETLPKSLLPVAYAALGRVGDEASLSLLEKKLASSHAVHAAHALALCESEAATDTLERALSDPKTRRNAARASVTRRMALGEDTPGLVPVLEALLTSADPADRAAGAWGLSAISAERAATLIMAEDPVVVMAAARNAYSGPLARAAVARLASEKSPELSLALSNALSDESVQKLVPTSKLRMMVQTGSVTACLAGRVLAVRLAPRDEALVRGLLSSTSREVRAEAALGLGSAPAPSAASLLEDAYEFEVDAVVRRAIVAAVTERPEARKTRLLRLASRLDPDPMVRHLATLGLSGHSFGATANGTGSFWLNLEQRSLQGRGQGTVRHAVVLQQLRGHTRVAFPDPDGFVGLLGLDGGGVSYSLAEPTG